MKKVFAILVALMLVLSMSTVAMAETGTITINNAVAGQTYTIYEILKLESYHVDDTDTGSGQYAYKATESWNTFINSDAIKGVYVEVDGQGYVTWKDGASAAEFAKKAQDYAAKNTISNQGTTTADTTTVTFTNLELGYYLMDSSLGVLCSLDTTNPSVTIQEKNTVPSLGGTDEGKLVKEDSNNTLGKKNDADMGQEVEFQVTIKSVKGATNLVLHDQLPTGMDFVEVTSVSKGDTALAADKYTVTSQGLTGESFKVAIDDSVFEDADASTTIVVKYKAKLNSSATVAGNGNVNKAWLTYGDSNTKSADSNTTTYTWEMPVKKYAMKDGNEIALAGATFTLSKASDGTSSISFTKVENENTYRVDPQGSVTSITTDTSGEFKIEGLDSDTYYLVETAAPAGYNKLAEAVKVVISDTGAITVDNASEPSTTVKVLNSTGSELPSTGGIGTTIFYVVGGLLMAAAVVLLVTKKKVNASK